MDQDMRDRFIAVETSVSNFQTYYKDNEDRKHAENREDNRKIFDWLEKLPCEVHSTRIKANAIRINWLYVLLSSVIIAGVSVFIRTVMAG